MSPAWYRIRFPCPRCGRFPALHLPEWIIEAARAAEEERPVVDYQCQRPTCRDPRTGRRTTFVISAYFVQRAELIVEESAA